MISCEVTALLAKVFVTPLRIDAGETSTTAAFVGSIKSVSSRACKASANRLRTNTSADGVLKRINSSESTAIAATLFQVRV